MSQRSAVLLYPAALAGIAAVLFYAMRRERQADVLLQQLRDTIEHDAT